MKLDTAYFEKVIRKAERYDAICDLLGAPSYAGFWGVDMRNAIRTICGLPEEPVEPKKEARDYVD